MSVRFHRSLGEGGPGALARQIFQEPSPIAPLFPLTTVPFYRTLGESREAAQLTLAPYLFALLLGTALLSAGLGASPFTVALSVFLISTFTGVVNFSREYMMDLPAAATATLAPRDTVAARSGASRGSPRGRDAPDQGPRLRFLRRSAPLPLHPRRAAKNGALRRRGPRDGGRLVRAASRRGLQIHSLLRVRRGLSSVSIEQPPGILRQDPRDSGSGVASVPGPRRSISPRRAQSTAGCVSPRLDRERICASRDSSQQGRRALRPRSSATVRGPRGPRDLASRSESRPRGARWPRRRGGRPQLRRHHLGIRVELMDPQPFQPVSACDAPRRGGT